MAVGAFIKVIVVSIWVCLRWASSHLQHLGSGPGGPRRPPGEVYIRGQGLDAGVIQSMLSEGSSIIQNEGTIIVCLLSQSLHCS